MFFFSSHSEHCAKRCSYLRWHFNKIFLIVRRQLVFSAVVIVVRLCVLRYFFLLLLVAHTKLDTNFIKLFVKLAEFFLSRRRSFSHRYIWPSPSLSFFSMSNTNCCVRRSKEFFFFWHSAPNKKLETTCCRWLRLYLFIPCIVRTRLNRCQQRNEKEGRDWKKYE